MSYTASEYAKLTRNMKGAEVLAAIREILEKAAAQLQGRVQLSTDSKDRYWLRVEQGFSIGCDLHVNFNNYGSTVKDDAGTELQYFQPLRITTELSWSSTGRNIAAAQASIALYQQLTNLAALLEGMFPHVYIYRSIEQVKEDTARYAEEQRLAQEKRMMENALRAQAEAEVKKEHAGQWREKDREEKRKLIDTRYQLLLGNAQAAAEALTQA